MQIPNETIQEFLSQPSQRVLSLVPRCLKDEKVNDDSSASLAGSACELRQHGPDLTVDVDAFGKGKAIHLGKSIDVNEQNNLFLAQKETLNGSFGHIKREQTAFHVGQVGNAHYRIILHHLKFPYKMMATVVRLMT